MDTPAPRFRILCLALMMTLAVFSGVLHLATGGPGTAVYAEAASAARS